MKRSSLLIGLIALAAACGPDDDDSMATVPDVTPPSSTTATESTLAPIATASTAPATSPTTIVPPPTTTEPTIVSTTVTTQPAATDRTAIVYASSGDEYAWLPVGWWAAAGWGSVEWPDSSVTLPQAEYASVSVASAEFDGGPMQGITGMTPTPFGCIDMAEIPSFALPLDLPDESQWWGYRAIAVTDADWDLQPRPVRAVGLDDPEYQQVGESLVPIDGPADPSLGDVIQVLRADLDGDGIEEVLLTFEHITPGSNGMPVTGDFSIVAARYPKADGQVVDEAVFEHVSTSTDFPDYSRARVAAVADLNGDGTMEVAIGSVYWEGAGVDIFEFRDGALHQVMTSGCGS